MISAISDLLETTQRQRLHANSGTSAKNIPEPIESLEPVEQRRRGDVKGLQPDAAAVCDRSVIRAVFLRIDDCVF
jgi:hypothetical protein